MNNLLWGLIALELLQLAFTVVTTLGMSGLATRMDKLERSNILQLNQRAIRPRTSAAVSRETGTGKGYQSERL